MYIYVCVAGFRNLKNINAYYKECNKRNISWANIFKAPKLRKYDEVWIGSYGIAKAERSRRGSFLRWAFVKPNPIYSNHYYWSVP